MSELAGYEALVARIEAVDSTKTLVAIGRRWQLRTVREAKLLVPRKTGNLGRTIHAGEVDASGASVIASAGYARWVEEGTRAHIIRPVRASVLAWGGDRRLTGTLRTGSAPDSFARSVNHPGTRAQPFLRPGALIALKHEDLAEEYILAWNAAA